MGGASEFGHPVALLDPAAQPPGAFAGQAGAERGGPGGDQAQAGQVVPGHGGVPGQRQHDRRDHVDPGHAVVLDQPAEALQVEPGHGDHRGPRGQAQAERDLQGEDVVQREHRQHHVVRADPVHGAGLAQAGHQVAVREQHALGQPGRPAGVQQHGVVVGTDRREAAGVVERRSSHGERQRRRPPGRPAPKANVSRIPAAAAASARAALRQGGRGDQPPGAGVRQLPGDVTGRRQRVDRGDARPGGQGRVVGDRELRAVGAAQRERVAVGHAAGGQPGRGPAHRAGQLGVGQHPAGGPVHEGRPVATPGRAREHEVRAAGPARARHRHKDSG